MVLDLGVMLFLLLKFTQQSLHLLLQHLNPIISLSVGIGVIVLDRLSRDFLSELRHIGSCDSKLDLR